MSEVEDPQTKPHFALHKVLEEVLRQTHAFLQSKLRDAWIVLQNALDLVVGDTCALKNEALKASEPRLRLLYGYILLARCGESIPYGGSRCTLPE